MRLNKLTNLADDIALALGATGVRIAPIPDKISMVGIEVPNKLVSPVPIRDVIDSREFRDSPSKVAFAVGRDISNRNIVGNIAKLPHLLIAGTTGSGKSVCTNSLIISLLYKATPTRCASSWWTPRWWSWASTTASPSCSSPWSPTPRRPPAPSSGRWWR